MKYVLMLDTIPLQSGSKTANAELLKQCDQRDVVGYVATTHPEHWNRLLKDDERIQVVKVRRSPIISQHGLAYWLMNGFYLFQLLFILCRLPKIDWLLGLSNPNNDMPLYLLRLLNRKPIVQIISQSVGKSRSAGYCVTKATSIYYLASCRESIIHALQAYLNQPIAAVKRYWADLNTSSFVNGLSSERWPKQANPMSSRVFWAATLLKRKNVDLLLDAIQLENGTNLKATVCYIQPNLIDDEYLTPDLAAKGVDWYESPANLDDLRAQCGVFVATAENEPFGLAILESLAAGMCVVIPHDDSYWDRILTDGKNCIKYTPNDAASLHNAIRLLNESPWLKVTMGIEALNVAQLYTAERCYFPITQHLCSGPEQQNESSAKKRNNVKGYDHV
ncbi:glycosyltransferase family 4 protein [Vibrio jasicida]|uniref:glycosyltransferase family 4 protein n=1 Tax=Vibrio jasicida TaxID=766224 RepID=UPI000CE5498C|nr:glycosyltransferase family 4 protein [Vibrio jasicida]